MFPSTRCRYRTGLISPVGLCSRSLMSRGVRPDRRQQANQRLTELGRRVRELREDADLTQEDVAERSGLDVRVIRYVETGSRDIGVSSLWPLADALGVAIADLFA